MILLFIVLVVAAIIIIIFIKCKGGHCKFLNKHFIDDLAKLTMSIVDKMCYRNSNPRSIWILGNIIKTYRFNL